MGIWNCTPASKQIISNYLLSLGKSKLQDIDTTDQAEHLMQQINPKCHQGHAINYATSGSTWKCDSKRSGGMCMQQMQTMITCYRQGCGGANSSTYFAFCLVCGFWGQ